MFSIFENHVVTDPVDFLIVRFKISKSSNEFSLGSYNKGRRTCNHISTNNVKFVDYILSITRGLESLLATSEKLKLNCV